MVDLLIPTGILTVVYPTNGQHSGENTVLYKVPPWSECYLSLGSLEDLLLYPTSMKHQDSLRPEDISSILIGRAPTILRSHWSRALEW